MGIADRIKGYKDKIKADFKARKDERVELDSIRRDEESKQKKKLERNKVRDKYSQKRKSHRDSLKPGSGSSFLFGSSSGSSSRPKKGSRSSESPASDPIYGSGNSVSDYISGGVPTMKGSDVFGGGEVDGFLFGSSK